MNCPYGSAASQGKKKLVLQIEKKTFSILIVSNKKKKRKRGLKKKNGNSFTQSIAAPKTDFKLLILF